MKICLVYQSISYAFVESTETDKFFHNFRNIFAPSAVDRAMLSMKGVGGQHHANHPAFVDAIEIVSQSYKPDRNLDNFLLSFYSARVTLSMKGVGGRSHV